MTIGSLIGLPARALARAGALEEDLRGAIGLLPGMADDLRRVRITIEPQFDAVRDIDVRVADMDGRLGRMAESLDRLEKLADEVTPDEDGGAGPLSRARDALTPG